VLSAELAFSSIAQLRDLYRERKVSPTEVAESLLERVSRIDPLLNSYATVLRDGLGQQAASAERELMRGGPLGALHGIPLSIKDNLATAGVRTAAGSRALAAWVPERDADCVSSLREQGALIAGKTNMFEFAFGEAHDDYGHVRNPWKLDRATAGSSTGSVAAVAAGLCWGSLASDTGGSIRVPAAMCGVVGLKPTYDVISRRGLVETSPSLDHIGPIARGVEDTAVIFDALTAGECAGALEHSVNGMRIAVARAQPGELIDPQVRAAFESACAALDRQGASLREVDIPDFRIARAVLWAIASVEAADLHRERLRRSAADYHPVVRARLEAGARIPGHAYVRAQRVRLWLVRELDRTLAESAALLLPVSPITAYPLGARRVNVDGHEEDVGQAVTRYTPLASVTGRPAVALPCGLSSDGLPIAFQVLGHQRDEATVLRIARAYERVADWQPRHPVATLDAALAAG